jgi:hypothetical protein
MKGGPTPSSARQFERVLVFICPEYRSDTSAGVRYRSTSPTRLIVPVDHLGDARNCQVDFKIIDFFFLFSIRHYFNYKKRVTVNDVVNIWAFASYSITSSLYPKGGKGR